MSVHHYQVAHSFATMATAMIKPTIPYTKLDDVYPFMFVHNVFNAKNL